MPDYPQWLNIRPIHRWPYDLTRNRQRARFRAAWGTTGEELRRELKHLGANGNPAPITLEIAARDEQIRRDRAGLLSGQTTEHPGVILGVESKHGQLSYPCDTFTDWKDNVRAITLTLRALRITGDYGVGRTDQYYRGFAQLEAAPSGGVIMAVDAAVSILTEVAGTTLSTGRPWSRSAMEDLYRDARRQSHPDRNGGDDANWNRVENAGKALRAAGQL